MSSYVPPTSNDRLSKAPVTPDQNSTGAETSRDYSAEKTPSMGTRFVKWMTEAKRARYSTSVIRILYGVALFSYFIPSFQDRHYIWGVGSTWIDPHASNQGWATIFDLLFPKDNVLAFDIHYGIFLLAILLFTLGWRTKFITPFIGFFYLSLVNNSTVLSDGGDNLLRITLFFFIFMDLSQHWSLDALRVSKKQQNNAPTIVSKPLVPAWISTPLHNAAVILCGYQIMVVYVTSGIYKSMGAEWMNGTALYYSMTVDVFTTQPLLSQLMWQSTLFVAVGTFLSVWVQLLFPIMVLWRPTRIFALLFLLGMHFSIGLFLGIWPFSLPMMALDLLFVRDSSWQAGIKWLKNLGSNLKHFGKTLTAPSAS